MTDDSPHRQTNANCSDYIPILSRREFLAGTAAWATTATSSGLLAQAAADERVTFFLVGDTHYLANKEAPEELDERSRRMTKGLIDTLNALPGTKIPETTGGGTVAKPQGVIHAGDLIDSGDKNGKVWEKMQATEWNAFEKDFGTDGKKGRLKYPAFEVHGNHDGPEGQGVAIEGIIARNKRRTGLVGISANGLHCSWNWGPVHFVNLGIVVGQVPEVTQRRRYNPMKSLEFLITDLRENVGESGRPVIITHHIDVARYSRVCVPDDPENLNREWHPCDVRGFYRAIEKYNVIAILYGHTHARNVLTWDGSSPRAERGISVFNVDNSSHFHSENQAFFYFEIGANEMRVRECATKDGWRSYFWTPQTWQQTLPAV